MSSSAPLRTISKAQYEQLQSDIKSENRVAFYSHLFQYTGSEVALTMGETASGSGLTGGVAWAINIQIQKIFPGKYPEAIFDFSRKIANNNFGLITLAGDKYSVPSDYEMLKGARAMWDEQGLGIWFPGNGKLAAAAFKDGEFSKAIQYASEWRSLPSLLGQATIEAVGELHDSSDNYSKSLTECLRQFPNSTTNTYQAFGRSVTEVIAVDKKTVCIFPDTKVVDHPLTFSDYFNLSSATHLDVNIFNPGKYQTAMQWRDADGTIGTETYDTSSVIPWLRSTEVSTFMNNGFITRDLANFKQDGSLKNEQRLTTANDSHVTAYFLGQDGILSLAKASIELAPDSHSDIWGAGNTIHSGSGRAWAAVNGSDTIVNAEGTDNTLTLNGQRMTATGTNSHFWFGQNSSGSVSGDGNGVVANGQGVFAYVNGTNTEAYAPNAGTTFTMNGKNARVTAANGNVWFGNQSTGEVYGESNLVVADGTGIQAFTHGSNSNFVTHAAGNTLVIDGKNENVWGSGTNVGFTSGSSGGIHGNTNKLVANGSGIWAAVSGDGNGVLSTAAANTLTMDGQNNMVRGNQDAIWFSPSSTGQVFGNDDVIVANGLGARIQAWGDRHNLVSSGEYANFFIYGKDIQVNTNNAAINASADSTFTVYGKNNVIVAQEGAAFNSGDPSNAVVWRHDAVPSARSAPVHLDSQIVVKSSPAAVGVVGSLPLLGGSFGSPGNVISFQFDDFYWH